MKKTGWLFTALVAGGVVFASRGCVGGCLSGGGGDPDQKLASQFEDLCKIAKAGQKDPVAGVTKWGRYMLAHTGDMLKNLGDTFAEIEKIADDEKHDKRAYLARDRMFAPLVDCAEDWDKFGGAIESNDEASDKLERAMERLDRSFEIVFGGGNMTFRNLPSEMMRRFDAAIIRK